jgi:hypothetical protein
MIFNAKNEEIIRKWLEIQAKNHPKQKNNLENLDDPTRRSVLGNLCHAAGLKRVVNRNKVTYGLLGVYDDHRLPYLFHKRLGISDCFRLTIRGSRVAAIFLRENFISPWENLSSSDMFIKMHELHHKQVNRRSLAEIGDETEIDHATMGQLISLLISLERSGIHVFTTFDEPSLAW